MLVKRITAQIIDILIYYGCMYFLPVMLIVTPLIAGIVNSLNESNTTTDISNIIILFLGVYLFGVYTFINAYQISRTGQTYGYKIMNLKIISITNQNLTFKQALNRSIIKALFAILCLTIIFPVAYIIILAVLDGKKGILDLIFKTSCTEL